MTYPIPESRRAQILPPLAGLSLLLYALFGWLGGTQHA